MKFIENSKSDPFLPCRSRKRLSLRVAWATLVVVGASMTSASAEQPAPGKQTEQISEQSVQYKHRYLLYLPKDYDNKAKHPLMLFLHGAGERGDDFKKVKIHGPPKLIGQGKDFPFIVVSPQCKTGGWWEASQLSALVDHIEDNYKVDSSRIYVTGLSMGGYGTWSLAMYDPNRFAAIAPICGGGNPIAARYTTPMTAPAWVFHGAKDTAVPLSESEKMVKVLKAHKVDVKLTVYPEAGHDSWTETYNNPKLYEWLLEEKRD